MTSMQPQYQTFGGLQQQGVARPPKANMLQASGNAAPQVPNMPQQNGQPDLSQAWQQNYNGSGTNYQPGSYHGPGNFQAYQPSHFAAPTVQPQQHFTAPQGGQQVDQQTQHSVQDALMNPSRYGSQQAQDTFNVLNRQLTQSGNADYNRINEDMASRGLYNSTTAGGRLGDLATNLNNQRADYATQIATDQAKNYQADRSSAIAQGLGFGGQQFNQGLAGFGANLGAGQQRYEQQLGASQFGLGQNAQNFGQQLSQYGANQGEAQNQYNAGLNNAQFGLGQAAQNYGQRTGALQGLAGVGQQSFNNQMTQAGFNADQDYRNTQLWLQMLGQT